MANRPPSSGTSGRSSGGMTGIVSRIIHSGLLPLLRNASTTFSRFANLIFFWTDVSVFIRSRSSSESSSTSTRLRRSLIASAPIAARIRGYFSRSWRYRSSETSSWFFSSGQSPGSMTTKLSK